MLAHSTEVIQTGIRIAYGFAEPAARRRANKLAGRSVTADVFKTAKVICSSLADSGSGLQRCNFSMARSAIGVEAFPIPSKLALTLAQISSKPSPVFAAFGKKMRKTGINRRESMRVTPASENTCRIPHQRHSMPHNESESETAEEAPSNTASPTASIFPVRRANAKLAKQKMPKSLPSIGSFPHL